MRLGIKRGEIRLSLAMDAREHTLLAICPSRDDQMAPRHELGFHGMIFMVGPFNDTPFVPCLPYAEGFVCGRAEPKPAIF